MVSKYSIVRRKSLVSDNECSELFRLKKFPIHMLKAFSEQTTLCNDMIFGIDESCGFIQLLETIPKEILYKDSHSNAIGKTWYNHHELLADTVLKINPENVLEIGGGTGLLQSIFAEKNNRSVHWDIIEPEPHPIKETTARFIKGFFPEALDERTNYDLILHSHVLEHMEAPLDFLMQMANILQKEKFMVFSVPYLEKLLTEKAISVINFEHTCLLTEDFIDIMLCKAGFNVIKKTYYMNHSIIYMTQKLSSLATCKNPNDNFYTKYYHLFSEWVKFYKRHTTALNNKIHNTKNPVYFFGAHISAQFYNAFGLDFSCIKGILDNDPYKYNWQVSGLTHKITSPAILEDVKSPVVILPESPYKNEIASQLQKINGRVLIL